MPILRNPKHERVAQERAALRSPYEACEVAGYNPANSSFKPNARKICQRADIRARVAEIQARGAELAAIEFAWRTATAVKDEPRRSENQGNT